MAAIVMIVANFGSTIATADTFLFWSTNGLLVPVAGVTNLDTIKNLFARAFDHDTFVQAAIGRQHFQSAAVTFRHCLTPLSATRVHGQGFPWQQAYRLRSGQGRPQELLSE